MGIDISRKKNVIRLGLVLAVFVFGSFFFFIDEPGLTLPEFTKVEKFSRADEFSWNFTGKIRTHSDIYGLDINLDPEGVYPEWFPRTALGGPRLVWNPDGTMFYACAAECLFEFDGDRNFIRRIAYSEFDLPNKSSRFMGKEIIGFSGDKLWLVISPSRADGLIVSAKIVVEWDIKSDPSECLYVEAGSVDSLAVDYEKRIVYTFRKNDKRHPSTFRPIEKDVIESRRLDVVHFDTKVRVLNAEYNSRYGILTSGQSHKIRIFDPKKKTFTTITRGLYCRWGMDDNIYFVRGTSQL